MEKVCLARAVGGGRLAFDRTCRDRVALLKDSAVP